MPAAARASLYDEDFVAWTEQQAARLRAFAMTRPNLDLDLENIAEEIGSMGRRDLRAAESALVRVIEHVLKLEHATAEAPRAGWRASAREHRRQLRQLLRDSPSLKPKLDLAAAYADGRAAAEDGLREHGEATDPLPRASPYALEQLLDDDWWLKA